MSNRCKMKGIVICGRPWAIRLLLCVAFLFSYISLLKISAQEQSYDQFFMEAMVQRQKMQRRRGTISHNIIVP